MLAQMSSSQFAQWSAYFRSLSAATREERLIGSGRMRPGDWKRMNAADQKQAQKQMYGMFRNYAVASGLHSAAGGMKRQ
jgi:hypothetical protein